MTLRLAQGVEDLAIEQFVPEPGIEALDVAVLPRASRSDVGGLASDRRDPLLDGLGDELRAVVGADVARHAAQDGQVGEHVDDVDGLELASDADRQALVRELVDAVEHPEPPSVVRPVLDEVVGPDVVAMLGPQPDARSVRQPEPSAFGLLPGDLQPLASPNPLDPLVVDEPACSAQQLGDLAVAVASVLPSKLDGAEPLLVVSTTRDLALRRAMLAERRAGATLGYSQLPANVLDADPATRGA